MTGDQLKQLENNLWQAADQLKANSKLTASEYSFPMLGLILVRHAYSRFKDAKVIIQENLSIYKLKKNKNSFLYNYMQLQL